MRLQPLLLIKPRGTGPDAEDLVVNDALVQLLDLREYVCKAVDEGAKAYPEREAVNVHIPLYWYLGTFTSLYSGSMLFERMAAGNSTRFLRWMLNTCKARQALYPGLQGF